MPIFIFLSIGFLLGAWLFPFHQIPWPTFGSEILTFISAACLLLSLFKHQITLPKPQLILLPIITIPLLQFAFGQVFYLSNAILSTAYLLLFWCLLVAGYNVSISTLGSASSSNAKEKRQQVFKVFSLILLVVGLFSSLIAIFQWLNLNSYFSPWMYNLKGSRPYANMAQPNNLATLLFLGILACLYLFEKRIIKNIYLIPISLIILFGIVLAQSRTSLLVCAFIVLYWSIKQFNRQKRLNWLYLVGWVGLFGILTVNLDFLTQLLMVSSALDLNATSSAVERAANGMGDIRIEMWLQMWTATLQQPWFGYGWNQTGLAQYDVTSTYPVPLWYKSAHNMILDILVWNGLIIGGLIIAYFAAWLYWLNKGVKDTLSIVATLMVCAILIHGMLEFPLHYAYFLLPAGFLLGVIQAQYPKLPAIRFNGKWFALIAMITVSCSLISVRDYFLYKEQSRIAGVKTQLTTSQKAVMQRDIILLTQFKTRVWWIQLDPKTKMDEQQLADLNRMVANMASKYDLYKYAQVLAFNGRKAEAEQQLWILETLHRQKRSYTDLLKSL